MLRKKKKLIHAQPNGFVERLINEKMAKQFANNNGILAKRPHRQAN